MKYSNVSSLVGGIVGNRLATLHELETWYSYEDALNLAEILHVKIHNENVANTPEKYR